MAINTSVEPFIQRMLMPPDPKTGAELASGTINNFLGAYQARKDVERDEAEKRKNDPGYVPQGGFQRFARGVLGAPGAIEEGRQPFSVQNRALAERNVTLSRQIDSLMKDPLAIAKEIGDLTPDQIPEWIQKNAGLAANPLGKAMLDSAGKAYSSTKQAQIQAGRARHLGELAERYPNVDLNTPEGLTQAQKNESVRELYNRAYREGRSLNALPDDWFNPDGTINEQKAVPGIGTLPRSEALQSRQEIAMMRESLIGQRSELDRALRERKISLDEYNAQARNIDRRLRAYSMNVELEGIPEPPFGSTGRAPSTVPPPGPSASPPQPGLPGYEPMAPMITPERGTSGPVTFRPIEPRTAPGMVKELQEKSLNLDTAIASINDTLDEIRSNPNAFGARGVFGELIEDLRGQINPQAEAKTGKARQQAGVTFTRIANGLRAGPGAMSDYEQRELAKVADVRGWRDFQGKAEDKMQNLKNAAIAQKLRINKGLNKAPELGILTQIPVTELADLVRNMLLDDDDLIAMVQIGKITKDQVAELRRLRPQKQQPDALAPSTVAPQ